MLLSLSSLIIAALLAPWLARRLGPRAWLPLAAVPALVGIHLATLGPLRPGDPLASESWPWVPGIGVELALRLDGLSLVFALLVCGVGALVVAYASSYLAGDRRLGRLYALLLLFQACMLGLVLADDAIVLFVFWEGTSITSYLLIGFDHERPEARRAAFRALFVTGAGGLCLLVGLLWAGHLAHTTRLSEWAEASALLRAAPAYPALLALVLCGAFTKSAQFPFHFWLPGAMAAPTPVSAYLHSATMVKAGVYLLLRVHPALGGSTAWHVVLSACGATTFLLGALLALGQRDLKRLLAFTTVGGLGTLVTLIGIGSASAIEAALVFLLVHALYKGALFLVAGIVDHETGTRDLARLGGLRRTMPRTALVALLACASMAGLPPLLGFLGKELVYEAKLGAPAAPFVLTTAGVLGNVLFVAAALTLLIGPFAGATRTTPRTPHDPPLRMLLPAALLAGLGLLLGAFPQRLAAPLVAGAAAAARGEPTQVELALWHGFNPVLALSVATLLLGALVWRLRPRLVAALRPLAERSALVGTQRLFDALLAAIGRLAQWQTGLVTRPRLRGDVLSFLFATFLLVGIVLVTQGGPRLPLAAGPLGLGQAEALLLTAAGALAVARARGKIAVRVVLLGVTGLGVTLTFLSGGGLDLALTQLAVETLAVLLFAFALLRAPLTPTATSRFERTRDALVGTLGGALLAALLWTALSAPAEQALSEGFVARSVPEGKGRNVVNVILVDFRSLDTLGEIAVLALAALGVLSLLRQPRPSRRGER